MLRSLLVRNYVLIDSLEVDFPEGLVIITGQTGAGKSILLGALSLVTGAKADASIIGPSGDNCVVEAEFCNVPDSLRPEVEEAGADWNDGSLLIRRVVSSKGRPRSFVNDCPVPVGTLSALSLSLVDIHSQNQTALLSDRNFQMEMLDHYAGSGPLADSCRKTWKRLTSLEQELSDIVSSMENLARDREYDMARFNQLDSAKLVDGELEKLEEEQRRLSNAEQIKENLSSVESIMSPQDEMSGLQSMDSSLKEVSHMLSRVGKFIPDAEDLSKRVESSRLELGDVLSDVMEMNSRMDVSADRLEEVEGRMSLIYGLFNRFGAGSIAELVSIRDSLSARLYDSTALEEKRDQIEKEISSARKELEDIAAALHDARAKAAPELSEKLQSMIRGLELDKAKFQVEVEKVSTVSSSGSDNVHFLFSSTGHSLLDISKCASGGEKSRIMLCLKAMMARYTNMPTMIFDEIDTGVSGSAADRMGTMICDMGHDMQVFAITHLPQVAAKGSFHILVEKKSVEDKAVSVLRILSPQERVDEIARMLSGSKVTPAAIANAKELIG